MNTGIASRYVYRGIERSALNWQAAIEGSVAGWQGRFWSSRSFSSGTPSEVQSMLGYRWSLLDEISVELKGTHFWYVHAPIADTASHSFEGAVDLSWNTHGHWHPSIELAYDIRFRSRTVEAAIARDFSIKAWGSSMELRGYGGNVAAQEVLPDAPSNSPQDDYSYFGASAHLRHMLTEYWSLQLEISMAGTINQADEWSRYKNHSGSRGWFALGTNYRF